MKASELIKILTTDYKYDYFACRRLIKNMFDLVYPIDDKTELDKKKVTFVLNTLKNNRDYPLEYLEGSVIFYSRLFKISPDVLIPRNETEELIEIILTKYSDRTFSSILDVGTGSGVMGITLSLELKLPVTLLDLSTRALKIADYNARHNEANYEVVHSDFLSEIVKDKKTYDLIVSNPPYIGKCDEVGKETRYEPKMALFSDNEGLGSYFRIISQLDKVLLPDGLAFFEISSLHHENYTKLQDIYPHFNFVFKKDSSGKWRYMVLEKK